MQSQYADHFKEYAEEKKISSAVTTLKEALAHSPFIRDEKIFNILSTDYIISYAAKYAQMVGQADKALKFNQWLATQLLYGGNMQKINYLASCYADILEIEVNYEPYINILEEAINNSRYGEYFKQYLKDRFEQKFALYCLELDKRILQIAPYYDPTQFYAALNGDNQYLVRLAQAKNLITKFSKRSVIDFKQKNNFPWLHYALSSGSPHLVQYMIDCGAPVDIRNTQGKTGLMWLAQSNGPVMAYCRKPMVELLLNNNADRRLLSTEGCDALAYAQKESNTAIVETLKEYFPKRTSERKARIE